MKTLLKSAFLELPYCIATYVCLIGMGWLLFFGWTPVKLNPPIHKTHEVQASAQLKAIELNGKAFQVAHTGSMEPLLKGGEWIVAVADYPSIQKGQILVYQAPYNKNPLLHRAVEKDHLGWIMSGDSAPHTESWFRVTPESYIGTAIIIYTHP